MSPEKKYIRNIERLAKKNNVLPDVMIKYWQDKCAVFDEITDTYNFCNETKMYSNDSVQPFIALTINGSIIIASSAQSDRQREIQYLPIEIRCDESSIVPKKANGKLSGHVEYLKKIDFENLFSTSPVIKIKTADEPDKKLSAEKTAQFTKEITDVFTKINNDMMHAVD
ncbi:MAG: hypothetical protein J1G30_09940 [Spirochaetales bacterium]|nr:hypothetical protein [Spirochaetales bacterium]